MKNLLAIILLTAISLAASSQQYGWTDISTNMPEQGSLSDIHVIGEEVWISGGNDKVFYSPDGGVTFLIQDIPPQPGNAGITSSIYMKNKDEGYVVTYSGEINKTDDGGTNWYLLHNPPGGLTSVHFPPNSNTGYTCGWGGKIWSFDDHSITDLSVEGLTADLLSIMFPEDTLEGKLCGDSSIRRWLNSTWNNFQVFDNNFVYNSIFFTDNNTGWVVGSQGKIFKTIDATIWNPQMTGITNGLYDVFFIDTLEGWAAGVEILLHTTDGGENWTEVTPFDFTEKTMTALWFNSSTEGYMVSNKGNLYKYTDVSAIADDELEELAFELYPNPCQDKITVRSSILDSRSSIFELIDITGKKIYEREMGRGGEGEMSVDVSHLPAGMYLVKLQTEEAVGVRKLIVQ
ncbi:MAG: YCF48-related protein [Bacteroidales bacterium]|jgi:photosystem II stability/assembly factor-like uncharacterized protein|nr:YCF48-related protein [Bacteroidales bacterium]